MSVLTKMLFLPMNFPLVRGMVSYAVIWPTCSIVQEYLEHGTSLDNANWARAARFGFFGTFFMAPVFYGWMKYSSRFFARKDLITAMTRAAVEQISYSPLAMAYFFFGMSLLEGKSFKVCMNEVREKFWPTYKIGVVFWPTAQTLNFYFISEKNRIVFVSMASFVWTVYLAHMKGKQQRNDNPMLEPQPLHVEKNKDKSPMLVRDLNSDMNQQKTITEVQSDIEDVNVNNPILIVDRSSELIEKGPRLVSDVHNSQKSLTQSKVSDSAVDNKSS